ncbi:MetQ/NlpA family ABC transporter substrate-binding protein [Geobacillus kaustophilus]|uniref:MetQ/NlpA family ABC transporter substrate-binding protein n=1 Tax=Geobacillus kaustophilus TaxID=1462 RepID=UPI002E248F4E|nr:MetQ/NlpA family ABC transporter substrate-binding protein [Geobacillus kaustophilus]
MKRFSFLFALIVLIFGATGCSSSSSSAQEEKKTITIGATAGPYSDQIREAIQPYLEKKGYKVKLIEFNDYVQPNIALDQKEIDANVFQNQMYLENFAKTHQMKLHPLISIPTVPIGLYSKKHTSLDDIRDGTTIALPNEPVNQARALTMLQQLGLLELKKDVEPTKASEKDIVKFHKNIILKPLDPAQLPRALGDVDYALINGNFALSSGLKLTEAVALEKTPDYYLIVVTIRPEDKDKPFVKDLIAAYKSKEFAKLIKEDPKYKGYVWPDWFQKQ